MRLAASGRLRATSSVASSFCSSRWLSPQCRNTSRNAGAFYAYISRGLGKLVGGGSAYVALFSYSIESIGFYGAFAYFAQFTFNDLFGVDVPWQV